MSKQLSIMDTN